jgi:hypothetical protein
MGIGKEFQEETKYTRGKIPAGYYGAKKVPEPFKTCPGAPKTPPPPAGRMAGPGPGEKKHLTKPAGFITIAIRKKPR